MRRDSLLSHSYSSHGLALLQTFCLCHATGSLVCFFVACIVNTTVCITDLFYLCYRFFYLYYRFFYLYYRYFVCITDILSVLQMFFPYYRCFFCITDVFSVLQMFFLYYRCFSVLQICCLYYILSRSMCLLFQSGLLLFLHLANSWKHWGCEEGPAEGLSNASGFAEGPGHWETAFGPAQRPSPMWKVNLALQKGVPGHHVVRAQVLHL